MEVTLQRWDVGTMAQNEDEGRWAVMKAAGGRRIQREDWRGKCGREFIRKGGRAKEGARLT